MSRLAIAAGMLIVGFAMGVGAGLHLAGVAEPDAAPLPDAQDEVIAGPTAAGSVGRRSLLSAVTKRDTGNEVHMLACGAA